MINKLSTFFITERNINQIQTFFVLGLLACIILGSLFVFYIHKNKYNTAKSLHEIFWGNDKSEKESKEFDYQCVAEQRDSLLQDHINAKLMLKHNEQLLRDYSIYKLLEYSDGWMKEDKNLEKYHLKPRTDYNLVVLFSIRHMDEEEKAVFNDNYIQNMGLHKFVIKNIYSELIMNYFYVEIGELGEQLAVIVSLPSKAEMHLEVLRKTICNLQQISRDKFALHVEAFIGDMQKGLEGIHVSYLEAKEASAYSELLDTDMIFFEEIKSIQKKYYYPIEMEQKIINVIKMGKHDLALDYINEVLEMNYNIYKASLGVRNCILFDMMSTVIKAAQEGGFADIIEDILYSKKLSEKLSLTEVKEYFEQVVIFACTNIQNIGAANECDKYLSKKIINYIQEQYDDPNLNISQTGVYFNMTPAYISSVFKRQTGESMLEYINTLRIEKAIQLLKEGYSVVEIAGQVGFINSGAFIRVFKRITGVTPGQMKSTL